MRDQIATDGQRGPRKAGRNPLFPCRKRELTASKQSLCEEDCKKRRGESEGSDVVGHSAQGVVRLGFVCCVDCGKTHEGHCDWE